MTLTYYQVRPNGDTNEANWQTVTAATLPQAVSGLTEGSYQVRALASGNWSSVVTVTAATTAPAAFTAGQWSLNAAGEVTLSALPADGGSTITAVEYQIGAGSWTALSGFALNTAYATAAEETDEVKIRAVNAVGNGAASDTKTVPAAGRVFFDDFNRTGRLQDSSDWVETGVGTYTLSTAATGDDDGYCYADASSGAACRVTGDWEPDQYSEVVKHTVNQTGDSQGARAIVRSNSAGDTWYRFHVRHTGAWVLEKILSGTVTTPDSGTITAPGLNTTYTDRLEVVGNTLRGYHNGSLVVEFTDNSSPITTGAPGMSITSSATDRTWARALKFEAGEL